MCHSLQTVGVMLQEEDAFYCHIKARGDHEVTLQVTAARACLATTCLPLAAISAPAVCEECPTCGM